MVKKLILCEGGDDIAFLNRYLSEFLCIDKKTYEIRKMENKSNCSGGYDGRGRWNYEIREMREKASHDIG